MLGWHSASSMNSNRQGGHSLPYLRLGAGRAAGALAAYCAARATPSARVHAVPVAAIVLEILKVECFAGASSRRALAAALYLV